MKPRPKWLAIMFAALLAGPALAAESKDQPPAKSDPDAVDAELLEFLGSLDAEGEDWREYLAERPIQAAAREPASKPVEGKNE